MAGQKPIDAENLNKLVHRSNTALLLYGVILFQVTAMLLLAFRIENAIDMQAVIFAVAMPLCTIGILRLFSWLWPIDRALLILMLFLESVSLVTLKAIARSSITPKEQGIYILFGFLAMAFAIQFIRSVRLWEKWIWLLVVLSVGALLAPFVLGRPVNGAHNWIQLRKGGRVVLSVQPSEFVKFCMVYVLAALFSRNASLRSCIPGIVFAAVLCGVLVLTKDLGAVLIFFLTTIFVFYGATSNLPLSLLGVSMGSVAAVVAYNTMDLVRTRVALYLDPWSYPQQGGYQLIQALVAIGSGGMFGMGLNLGEPRNIPLYHSDFIFSAIVEQYGLVFSIALIGIYVLIFLRGISIAKNARTSFHALLAFGVVAIISIQTFINIGGNIQFIPLTGVTLPFVSSGGSSIVAMMGGMGLLLGVSSINANDENSDLQRLRQREAISS